MGETGVTLFGRDISKMSRLELEHAVARLVSEKDPRKTWTGNPAKWCARSEDAVPLDDRGNEWCGCQAP